MNKEKAYYKLYKKMRKQKHKKRPKERVRQKRNDHRQLTANKTKQTRIRQFTSKRPHQAIF